MEITEFADGEPLKFTAEVDVRPEITLPGPGQHRGDRRRRSRSATSEIDEQVDGLRERFATLKTVDRPAAEGDYVQIDLTATVDGEEVPGGSATNLSHEVGSKQLLPGLDEVAGRPGRRRRRPPSPPSWSAATTPAGTPRSR